MAASRFGREFKRPDTVPFPKIWRRFKGRKPMLDDRIAEFWIQDATEDMAEEIANHFCKYFVHDETLTKSMGHSEELSKSDSYKKTMMDCVKDGLTVAAFTTWPDGERHLVGANPLYVMGEGDMFPEATDEVWRRGLKMTTDVMEKFDVHKIYGEELYTSALGLSVAREFRGQNVGVELLKARLQLTKALGLRLSINFFSSAAAQIQAERAGFELVTMGAYKDLKDVDGTPLFPETDWPIYQFRAKLIVDKDGDFE